MAAEVLSASGVQVRVYERMPSLGRKFLMAGRGGLNLTHAEPLEAFLSRYGPASTPLETYLRAFPPPDVVSWAEGLGQSVFTGSSGRVFPTAMKASPLLRAWLARLVAQGVTFHTRTAWTGFTPALTPTFDPPSDLPHPNAVILAMGGASWPRLGSDGRWSDILAALGVDLSPLHPANCGFEIPWSAVFRERFAGQPLKALTFSFAGRTVRGEAMVADYGLEGGAIYALSAALRDALLEGRPASVEIDLRPNLTTAQLTAKLSAPHSGQTLTNRLRKALRFTPLETGILREAHGQALPAEAAALANRIKRAKLDVTAARPLDRAISTAGGVRFSAVDDTLMLKALPGVYAVGEMLDWEAPTGGYLLQACFATGAGAARAILAKI